MRNYITPIIFSIAIIVSVIIASATLKYKFRTSETIMVTGMAEKDFASDQIVWKGTFTRSGYELQSTYSALKNDEAAIRDYLHAAGLNDSNILFKAVDMMRNYETKYDDNGRMSGSVFNGYTLTGTVTVDSRNIPVVETMARKITALLQKGIELNSTPPSYYYSGLNELKIDLLAKAAEDARQRAESIAKNSGVSLGALKNAHMGVFQITGKNSNEDYSYGGVFNTSSKEKTASITLRVNYQVK